MTTTTSKPINTFRDGSLKVTLWRNDRDNGEFYSIRLSRTWKDERGQYHDSDRFTGTELLRIARLANIAYDALLTLRSSDRDEIV